MISVHLAEGFTLDPPVWVDPNAVSPPTSGVTAEHSS